MLHDAQACPTSLLTKRSREEKTADSQKNMIYPAVHNIYRIQEMTVEPVTSKHNNTTTFYIGRSSALIPSHTTVNSLSNVLVKTKHLKALVAIIVALHVALSLHGYIFTTGLSPPATNHGLLFYCN